jgi:hypothetical protein
MPDAAGTRRLVCSDKCRRYREAYRGAMRRTQTRVYHWRDCAACGERFVCSRVDGRYCSGRCRTAASRARQGSK